ncbi:DUF6335 family protein [Leptolyngbya sp. NIES-2104]|uniref:DUF6335 family protein n=1 Tax=Leptolyngbya sp. NIES-2104 TaxID=1552121 RepID=UPI0006ECB46C|nr:DUF6335 family protein [Leptolyngbya sp. NIES-2104]GAP93783.1 hypothetical protein NIES2104_02910 [Leptolyngbya sp. NIES-2104]
MTYSKNPGYQDISDEADLEASLHNLGGDVEDDFENEDLEDEQDYGDVPQEYTESYGTGVVEMPGYAIGGRTMHDRDSELHEASAVLTGGDIDANYEQANAVGDESVGGTVSTPDMDIVDDLGRAVGLEMSDHNYLHTNEILEGRDDRRWELEPSSSEDYEDRRNEED